MTTERHAEDAAVAAFYEAHINRVYRSPKGRADNLTPARRRDGEASWRPAVLAALAAYRAASGTGAGESQ